MIGVALLVAGQEHRAVLRRHRLGADDRGYPRLARGLEKAGDGIEAVAVGEGEGSHPILLAAAQRPRGSGRPSWGRRRSGHEDE